jgi:hypothetical protein
MNSDALGMQATGSQHASLSEGDVEEALHALRESLKLDVVFVAEFVEGQRVFRFVDRAPDAPAIEPGSGHALEATFCLRVVDGRLPEFISDVSTLGADVDLPPVPIRIGTHISTPVVLQDGSIFGTLCCFSTEPVPLVQAQDMASLKACARLVARKLDEALARGVRDPSPTQMRASRAAYASPVWKLRSAWSLNANSQRNWLES